MMLSEHGFRKEPEMLCKTHVDSTFQMMVDPCQRSIIPSLQDTARIIFYLC